MLVAQEIEVHLMFAQLMVLVLRLPSRLSISQANLTGIAEVTASTVESLFTRATGKQIGILQTTLTARVDVVIMQTDTKAFKDLQATWPDEPGIVHGIIYREAFGESCKGMKVVGEGFAIMNGEFKIISGVFNPVNDDYHDNSSLMNRDSPRYVEAVVIIWKRAGPNFREKQNHSVKELNVLTKLMNRTN